MAPVAAYPEREGLLIERLRRIERLLSEDVAAGLIPGAAVGVARGGQLVYECAVGALDPSRAAPMRSDAIFRIYSMSKPLLSVAALSLVAEGRLGLDDPVCRFLPEFSERHVAVPGPKGLTLEPAERQPTIRDLLRHTSGIIGGEYDPPHIAALYAGRGIAKFDHTPAAYRHSLADLVSALAELPLAFQPGRQWAYGRSAEDRKSVV